MSNAIVLAELGFAVLEALQIQAEGKDISPEMWVKIRTKMKNADDYFDAAVRNRGET